MVSRFAIVLAAALLLVLLPTAARGEVERAKLIGVWEAKLDPDPVGMELKADGSCRLWEQEGEGDENVEWMAGTWTLAGDVLKVSLRELEAQGENDEAEAFEMEMRVVSVTQDTLTLTLDDGPVTFRRTNAPPAAATQPAE